MSTAVWIVLSIGDDIFPKHMSANFCYFYPRIIVYNVKYKLEIVFNENDLFKRV